MGTFPKWSYSGNPSESPKDQVRFLIGDTDENDQLLQDGEIYYLLGMYNNSPLDTAIRAVEGIMAKFSRMVNETVGGVRIDFTDKLKNMDLMKQALIQRLATTQIAAYAGGISISDMIQVSQNADRPCQPITLHEMENQQIAPWVSNAWLYGDQGWGGWGGGCGC
jgi:hypothetical protein